MPRQSKTMASVARLLLVLAPVLTNANVRGSLRRNKEKQDQSDQTRDLGNYDGIIPFSSYGSQTQAYQGSYGRHRGSSHYYQKGGHIQHYNPYHHGQYEVPCSPKLTHFTAEVFVDFNGDPSLVTFKDVNFLEEGFRNTYNYMSKRLCDDKFREIHSATAIHGNGESPVIPRGGLSFGLRYLVKGACRGCSYDSPLFAPRLNGHYHRTLSSNETDAKSVTSDTEYEQHERKLWQPHIEWNPRHPVPEYKKSYNPDYYGAREKQVRSYYHYSTKGSKTKSKKSSKSSKSYKSPKGSKSHDGGSYYPPTCTCESPNPKWRPPTEAGFAKAFNSYILQFANDDGIIDNVDESIQIVKDVTEIDAKTCTSLPSVFESFLEIEFTGDFNALTDSETSILESNVLAVYNSLSDKRCDLLFRDIDRVTLAAGEQTDTTFTALLLVGAECRGCNTADTTIFGDDNNRRELRPGPYYHSRPWYDSNVGTSCYCPIYGKNDGAPTDSAFEAAYRDAVVQLVAVGDLQNVTNVITVTEVVDDETRPPTAAIPTAGIPVKPSLEPSSQPSSRPSVSSDGGVSAPTIAPSESPTVTASPSDQPSNSPSATPSASPTRRRNEIPLEPSSSPSSGPSQAPSANPSGGPSDSPSNAPSFKPSTSQQPSPSLSPSLSQSPTISTEPSSGPSESMAPSLSSEPSGSPSTSMEPSTSAKPSVSSQPSMEPSLSLMPSMSAAPSVSIEPSETPSLSGEPSFEPSMSAQPSTSSEPSLAPSISQEPSISSEPSLESSISVEPSLSLQPSASPSLSSTLPSLSPSLTSEAIPPSTCSQDECVRPLSLNVDGVSRNGVLTAFPLGNVSFIQNVTVEIASEYGNDLEILLVSPRDEEYIFMRNTRASRGTGDRKDFDLGLVQGNGTLSNVDSYTFVQENGLSGFTSPFSSTGTYNARSWGTGTYRAGDWYFFVRDSTRVNSASIGQVYVRYCGICASAAPSSSPSQQPSLEPSVTQDTAAMDVTGGGRRRKKEGRLLRHRD